MANGNTAYPLWSIYVAVIGAAGVGAGGSNLYSQTTGDGGSSCAVHTAEIRFLEQRIDRFEVQADRVDSDYERRLRELEGKDHQHE